MAYYTPTRSAATKRASLQQAIVKTEPAAILKNPLLNALVDASQNLPPEYSKSKVEYINHITDSLATAKPEHASRNDISEAAEFYMKFDAVDLGLFLVSFKTRHPTILSTVPELYEDLLRRASKLQFPPADKGSPAVANILELYEKSEDPAAFATIACHMFKNETLPREIVVDIFIRFTRTIKSWKAMKTYKEAVESSPHGLELLSHATSAISSVLAAQKLVLENEQKPGFKKALTKVLKYYQENYGLRSHLLEKSVAFVAFQLSGVILNGKIDVSVLGRRIFSCIKSSGASVERSIVKLIEWDEDGLKSDKSFLDAVHLLFLRFLQDNPDQALSLSCNVWLTIIESFYWSANVPLANSFFEELFDFIGNPNNLPSGFPSDMPKKILAVHLGTSTETSRKLMLKENHLADLLEAWAMHIKHYMEKKKVQERTRDDVETWIKMFILAHKSFTKHDNCDSTYSLLVEDMANVLPLKQIVELLKWAFAQVSDISKLECKSFASLCSSAVASPELENYLDSCTIQEAEQLYGFALRLDSSGSLVILNEKIRKISSCRASNFREALVSSESLKKLAAASASKDAFDELAEGKSLKVTASRVTRNVGRHSAAQKRVILLEEPINRTNSLNVHQAPKPKLAKRHT